MTLGRSQVYAAVDCFASDCFISSKLVPEDHLIEGSPSTAKLAGEQTTMPLIGKTTITIHISDNPIQITAWVAASVREPLILGYPWLLEQNTIFELSSGTLYLGINKRFSVRIVNAPVPSTKPTLIRLEDLQQELPPQQQEKFLQLVQRFAKIFEQPGKLCQTQTTEHTIVLTTDRPTRERPYQYSESKRAIIRAQVLDMLENGIIESSSSPYNSPIVIAKKKDGGDRFCVNYKKLNSITEDVVQPIPKIQELLKDIGTATIFSTIDLKSGYWQIPMDRACKRYTAFTTPEGGTYQFRVMPFGLKNAPSTFQRFMMHEVLVGNVRNFSTVYLDDIIIFSRSWDEHLEHLTMVFERLFIHQLTCSIEKCNFGKRKLPYLGHLVSTEGNEARGEHIQTILGSPPPRTKKELQKFLGTCNWLREYIPDFATLSTPLSNLLAGKKTFKWTPEAQLAFENIQQKMREPLQLYRPAADLPYVLQTDTSDVGMSAVLYQPGPDGERRVVSYASAKFNDVHTRYELYEKECFAIVWAIRRYKAYLEGQLFTLRTDVKALAWLDKLKEEKSKLSQWALLLQELRFRVEPRMASRNELPRALALHPSGEVAADPDDHHRLLPPERPPQEVSPTHEIFGISTHDLVDIIREEQQRDPAIYTIATACQGEGDRYKLENNSIYQSINGNWKLLVPKLTQPRVLYEYHDSALAGHPGADETLRSIQEHFTWKNLRSDVREYVRLCYLCSCTKAVRPPKNDVLRAHRPRGPWETVALDLMGPYPRTGRGKRFILVITDLFSRWIEAFPLSNSEAPTIIKIFDKEILSRWGYPRAILTDNGPQFTGKRWTDACRQWQVQQWTTPIYHPRANPTERRNQEIKKGLRLHLHNGNQRGWDAYLPQILFTLRRRKNAATGVSPSEALLGKTIRRPGEWRLKLLEERHGGDRAARISDIQERQEAYQGSYAPRYRPGDGVYCRSHILSNAQKGIHAGLAPPWHGPFTVHSHLGSNVYLVGQGPRLVKMHGNELKPAHGIPPVATAVSASTGHAGQPKANSPIQAVSTREVGLPPPTQVSPVQRTMIDPRSGATSALSASAQELPNLTETFKPSTETSPPHLGTDEVAGFPALTGEERNCPKQPTKKRGRPPKQTIVLTPSPNPQPRYNLRPRQGPTASGKK